MTTEALRTVVQMVTDSGVDPVDLHWFDISDLPNGTAVQTDVLMECLPPFEKCGLVYSGKDKSGRDLFYYMFVVGTDLEDGILVSFYGYVNGKYQDQGAPILVYLKDGDTLRYGAIDDDNIMSEDHAKLRLAIVAAWYRSMLAKPLPAFVPYVKPTFTNKRKIAKGKTPTYDWNTVIIDPERMRYTAPPQGGTHASPRQHDRRGHLRRLRSGKNVWVRAHKVGRPELGSVFHDYEVRA